MTLIGDLPWLCIGCGAGALPTSVAEAAPALREVPANAVALALLADEVTTSHVVLVMPDIVPMAVAPALSPDPVLLASGRVLLWPALNDLTGEVSRSHGLWVIPTPFLKDGMDFWLEGRCDAPPSSPLVLPQVAATWLCGESPKTAFRAGFQLASGARTAAAALSASLGADRPNGLWWGIGACRGLLGGDVGLAWDEERSASEDCAALVARWNELARRVRVELGLPLHPLASDAAAALRQMRGDVADAALWDSFVEGLGNLGPYAIRLRAAHRLARVTLWSDPEPGA